MPRLAAALVPAVLLALAAAALAPAGERVRSAQRQQTTELLSRSLDGGEPNGPSTNPVISNDRRYARLIAFESEGSDLVSGDTNAQKDVFVVNRGGRFGNRGTPWQPGRTVLVSRGLRGRPANGPSFAPAVDGGFHSAARCVAFLSSASNLVRGDTNRRIDAFLAKGPRFAPTRVSLPRGRQSRSNTTAVAVSGDCSRVAFVSGNRLYTRVGRRTKRVSVRGAAADPSFDSAASNDLVFGAPAGVYLSKKGTGRPRLVGRGGRNPGYNGLKRQTVAYEKLIDGRSQIVYHDIGKAAQVISGPAEAGNGDSRNPSVANSGFYVTFETDATNLGERDANDRPDVYLYTDSRKLAILQSVGDSRDILPGGGQRPAMSWYANYIVFESQAPLEGEGTPQVLMRWLGEV
jgi:hypothetical protein